MRGLESRGKQREEAFRKEESRKHEMRVSKGAAETVGREGRWLSRQTPAKVRGGHVLRR